MAFRRLDGNEIELSHSEACVSQKLYIALRPYEAPILHLQRLLVWENYLSSTMFVVLAHLFFGYLFMRSDHVFGIFFMVLLILVWVDMWKHKIWPEIRAVDPDADSEWGEMNPHLLSVREMCDRLALLAMDIKSSWLNLMSLRKSNHGTFCLYVSVFCLLLMIIGHKIPGILLSYLLMLSIIFSPLCVYHRLPEKIYVYIEPILTQLRYTLQQRPGNNYELARSIAVEQVVNSPDEDIDEFVPSLNDNVVTELAKAVDEETNHSETDEELDVAIPEPIHPNEYDDKGLHFFNTYLDPESEDDDFGLPNTNKPTTSNPSLPFPGEMAGIIGDLVKDTLPSMTNPLQSSSDNPNIPSGDSNRSSDSDYEIIGYSSGDEEPGQ